MSPFSIDGDADITLKNDNKVMCKHTGRITLIFFGRETTYCPMNLRYFPFDKQTCSIEFAHIFPRAGISYLSVSNGSNFKYYIKPGIVFFTDSVQQYTALMTQNGEWELLNLTLHTEQLEAVLSQNHNETYPFFEIVFELKRKPTFYVIILMLPTALVNFISVIGFLLPSEAGEKVSLQLTALLSYVLLVLVVVDIIPPVGENFPLIGEFYFP